MNDEYRVIAICDRCGYKVEKVVKVDLMLQVQIRPLVDMMKDIVFHTCVHDLAARLAHK